ncbi:SDR family NAD(P)-dependent oxidoreductase [Mucilaginibacter gossypii]|uniref:SDR family NAD(P)-dependent oxidoreductase n=1 Tax=Mucilaginibacter gossypii TaxID=551996 RepID=UPI000DCD25A0|nr:MULTISPECIES: SDR family NAD(P)-dependent oxidoreductase [Mucilaginibacter]QTE38549.1 SDR family NAD(P)-dependent oxidoreductase [Mucilaginibacter gossypii]RAV52827.1 SDR family NAD(P)-dependent oxidoreductase [Mucilaginibacter rubeus]
MSKVIVITGTNTCFGKLTALTLAASGHSVIATMRNTAGKNKNAADELAATDNIEVVEMDVADDESVSNGFNYIINKYGSIDVLINNAAVTGFGVAEGYSIDAYKKMFEINFYGAIRTYQAALPVMRKLKQGLIINLSTGASGFSVPYMVPYMASKFALETFIEGIDSELREFGIENVSIPCGVYPTGMGDKGGYNADRTEIATAYPDFEPRIAALGMAMFSKMQESNMNPQAIADGIKALIDMEKGFRPLRYPIDAIAQGTDQEFITAKRKIKRKWAAKYGIDF